MPKMKTHKGTKKRFTVSATGKVMHKRCGSSHLNSHKSGNKIRKLKKKTVLRVGADAARLRAAMRTRRRGRLVRQPDVADAAATPESNPDAAV
ncbi:MAG: 50S ribosomal protein L35 [Isosphaeraceae bacterium]